MNYQKIYDNIINRSKNRNLNCYIEKHHILPKSLGGTNDSSNIISLTAKEHYICHFLLTKIYPCKEMTFALWCMINGNGRRQRYIPYSRTYEKVKSIHSEFVSNLFKGKTPWNKGKHYFIIKLHKGVKNKNGNL